MNYPEGAACIGMNILMIVLLGIILVLTASTLDTQKQLVIEFEALHKEVTHHKRELREVYEAMCDIEEATWIELPEQEQVKTR